MRQRITTKLRSAAGVSFAEMLACTVLFSLAFMVGTSGLLFAFHSTEQVMQSADAQTVSDAILNRIDGEIAGVITQDPIMMDNGGAGASIIGFTGSSGIQIYICSKNVSPNATGEGDPTHDKELLIYYRETQTNDATGNATKIPESYWTFDKAAYQGYKITDLNFTQGSHHKDLTVKTSLTLESPTGKSYTTTRTVCCYNRENTVVRHYSTADVLTPPADPSKQLEQATEFESALDTWLAAHGNQFTSSGENSKSAFYEEYYASHGPVQMPNEYRDLLSAAGLHTDFKNRTMYWWSYPITDSNGTILYTVTYANAQSDPKYWWTGNGGSLYKGIRGGYVVIVDGVTYVRAQTGGTIEPGTPKDKYTTKDGLIEELTKNGYFIFNG